MPDVPAVQLILLSKDFLHVGHALIGHFHSVPVDEFMENVSRGKAGINDSEEFCPYVGRDI